MKRRVKGPEEFIPFRIAEQSYVRSPRPEFSVLARAVGWSVAGVVARHSLVDSKGRLIKPVRMSVEVTYDPNAPRSYPMHGLTVRHPMRGRSQDVEYWGFPLRSFEDAKFVEPEDLAIDCAEALSRTLIGSPLWEPKGQVFVSAEPPISYNELANILQEEAALQPAGPLTVNKFTDYAARVGDRALHMATSSQGTGGVQLFPHTYMFVPKAQALRLQD